MAKITISYRRADSDAIAGRIRDRLAHHYGDDAIFMDIDSIPLGVDFRTQIQETLSQVEILLVIIGPRWRGPRSDGEFRIFDATDPCRVEVEQGLERGIPTIPVLVNDAEVPCPDELPESLQRLSYHNAAIVDAGRDFHQHMDRLIRSIDQILGTKKSAISLPSGHPYRLAISIVGAAVAATVLAVVFFTGLLRWPWAPPPIQSAAQAPAAPASSSPATAPSEHPISQIAQHYASSTEAAAACEPGTASIFYEDFESPDSAWSGLGKHSTGSTASFQNGQLLIRAAADDDRVVGHPAPSFRDASLCVRVISPLAVKDPSDPSAGVLFWASDTASSHPDRGFAAMIDPAGGYSVSHKSGDSTYDIVSDKQFTGVKTGTGSVNQVKVVAGISGNTIFVNGVKGQEFNAAPDDDTPFIGFVAASEKSQVNEWRFLDLVMVAPNFADELTDFGAAPQSTLHFPVGSETPTTIPGGTVLRTGELNEAIQKTALNGKKFLMFDVLADDHAQTIAGAARLRYAGGGTGFNDDVQRRLSRDLKVAAKNNFAVPMIFFCEGSECWESYNAALRAEKLGFTKVYWYRGGLFAWKAAGLPIQ